jgi:hypothetical protein
METKLRTLKDIFLLHQEGTNVEKILKIEARKWIETINKRELLGDFSYDQNQHLSYKEYILSIEAIKLWIKYFFGITDNDLDRKYDILQMLPDRILGYTVNELEQMIRYCKFKIEEGSQA